MAKGKGTFRFLAVTVFALVTVCLFVAGITAGAKILSDSGYFKVKSVYVKGVIKADGKKVENMVKSLVGKSIFNIKNTNIAKKHNDILLKPIPNISSDIQDWIALDSGPDVFWSDRKVFMMHTPESIEQIYLYKDFSRKLTSVVWDGRWLWISGEDQLDIFDSSGKAVAKIDADNGLPPGQL